MRTRISLHTLLLFPLTSFEVDFNAVSRVSWAGFAQVGSGVRWESQTREFNFCVRDMETVRDMTVCAGRVSTDGLSLIDDHLKQQWRAYRSWKMFSQR